MPALHTDDPSRLADTIAGQVILPDDPGYDDARQAFYGDIDRRPAAIARPLNAAEVSKVVDFARATGAELAIRSGGHSLAGHSVTEGGIVLDLVAMKAIEIDLEQRTAWAETGLTAGEYTEAAAAHGFATGFGDTGSVGIGGITLGGGVGFLVRKHGLTVDNLLAAEIVTADGSILEIDTERHPDLFWAIRGGGGNFGVATRLKFRLHEVDDIVGGMLVLPATPDVISGFVALAENAPDELSAIVMVMNAPPAPFLPEAVHGKTVLLALMVHAGDSAAGVQAVAPFRELAEPLVDDLAEVPYLSMFPPEPPFHPTMASQTMFMDHIDTEVAGTILTHLAASTAPMAAVQIRVLGGAMARVPVEDTAFAHRDARLMINVAAMYAEPSDAGTQRTWVAAVAAALHQGDDRTYVNFMGGSEQDGVRNAYPGATWDRLVAVKRRYDPDNLFRLNTNIPPGTTDAPTT